MKAVVRALVRALTYVVAGVMLAYFTVLVFGLGAKFFLAVFKGRPLLAGGVVVVIVILIVLSNYFDDRRDRRAR